MARAAVFLRRGAATTRLRDALLLVVAVLALLLVARAGGAAAARHHRRPPPKAVPPSPSVRAEEEEARVRRPKHAAEHWLQVEPPTPEPTRPFGGGGGGGGVGDDGAPPVAQTRMPGPTLGFFNRYVWPAVSGFSHHDLADWVCGTSVVCRWIADQTGAKTQAPYLLALPDRDLHGTIPTEIGLLTFMRQLDLSTNRIGGTLPSEIGLLENLEHLVLSRNALSGPIPVELGRLTRLKTLALDHNNFVGDIPAALSNLRALTALRLEYNRLTGAVPSELGRLNQWYLSYFFLSNNMLSGVLPTELLGLHKDSHCWLGNDADVSPMEGNCFACPRGNGGGIAARDLHQRCNTACHDYCPRSTEPYE